MLGFVLNLKEHFGGVTRFFPTSTFRPAAPDHPGMSVLDARHGRVEALASHRIDARRRRRGNRLVTECAKAGNDLATDEA
jgi:hypothetical protein